MTKLYICLKNDRIKEILNQVCKDIFIIDKSFNFTIFKNRRFRGGEKDCQFILSIRCADKDEAHRKGMWFVNKVDVGEEKLYYWVR